MVVDSWVGHCLFNSLAEEFTSRVETAVEGMLVGVEEGKEV